MSNCLSGCDHDTTTINAEIAEIAELELFCRSAGLQACVMVDTTRKKRTDELGRAFAGSQLQVQIYAARKQELLSNAVIQALAKAGKAVPAIQWVSPLEQLGFQEAATVQRAMASPLSKRKATLARSMESVVRRRISLGN